MTYEEAYQASLKYFNGNELAAKVFVDKYALKDENNKFLELTPTEMHLRLAKEFARIEANYPNPMTEEEIFNLFDKFTYIVPQGSPMSAIGNPYQIQSLGNCFAVNEPNDSFGGILHTDQQMAQLYKRRCGVGVSISSIRPAGMPTKNAAKTTDGVGVFMERFSNTCREVAINGRRGAQLQCISVHHPDIETFIKIKQNRTKVTGANVSIKFSDEFFDALRENKDYELRWPIQGKPEISKWISAKYIWNLFIDSCWNSAEPGALYWDTILKESIPNCYGEKYDAFKDMTPNPCFSVNSYVLTPYGISTVGKINIGDIIWSEVGWTKVVNKQSRGLKEVFKYKTTAGFFLGTENHKILQKGIKIEVGKAQSIDQLSGDFSTDITLDEQTIMDGLVLGDGSRNGNYQILNIGDDDQDYFSSEIKNLIIKPKGQKRWKIQTTILNSELVPTYNRSVPDRFKFGNRSTVCSFLRGLYSANGSYCGGRITLKQTSFQMVEDVQLMLSSVGIRSYYTTNKPSKVKFLNGEYLCKQSYDLNITIDKDKFVKLIGFIQKYKNDKIKFKTLKSNGKQTYDIHTIEYIGEEEVFDITVDNITHTLWSGCLNVGNCGELILGRDSCRLLLLNLFSYVKNPFSEDAYFDYDLFTSHSQKAQRLMDDMIDLEIEAINKILDKIDNDPEPEHIKKVERDMWADYLSTCKMGRRTGLGITALGDVLAALNIRYGSEESIETTDKIYKTLCLNAYISSAILAQERGHFPILDRNIEKDNPMLNRVLYSSPEFKDLYEKYGRRNIALLTTAPAGSVSILTETTSGIEPVFLPTYKRRKKGNPGDLDFRTDFIDQNGDHWQEFDVEHPKFTMWKNITGKSKVEDSPYNKSTSADIDWIASVKLQATAQKWVCHAISKTCNMPNNIDKETVSEAYLTAYKLGCKGFTIYRDGSRTGVLFKESEEKLKHIDAPKRPKTLPCDVHQLTVKGHKYMVFVGLFGGLPYEVMAYENGSDKHGKTGKLTKVKRGIYKAELEDGTIIESIADNCTPEEETITRLVSTSLRHGADISFIVHQLEKTEGEMNSFSKCLARTLKKYIKDGTQVSGESCPECTSNKVVRNSGCKQCSNCGWTACN